MKYLVVSNILFAGLSLGNGVDLLLNTSPTIPMWLISSHFGMALCLSLLSIVLTIIATRN